MGVLRFFRRASCPKITGDTLSGRFVDAVEAGLGEMARLVSERPVSKDAVARFKESMDREISDSPLGPPGIFARYLRARCCEEGVLHEQDIDAAMEDYLFIMNHGAELQSEGMVGYARLLHWKGKNTKCENANTTEALSLCTEAVRLDSNVRAMMFAGYISEHNMHDLESAASWYLQAFKNKLPWGLRFYASLQFRRKKYLVSILAHIAATMVSPFLVVRYGKKDPFRL